MAQTLERLTNRTETMRSIRSIVRTMKTMSAINALPYEQAALAIEAYRETTLRGFHAFVQRNGPLPTGNETVGLPIVVAFGSDHGLCGNYNDIVAEEVVQAVATRSGTKLICVGTQMENALASIGLLPERTLLPPASADGLRRLAGHLISILDTMRHNAPTGAISVSLVFVERAEHGQQKPVSQRLLPLDTAMIKGFAKVPWVSRSLPQYTLPPDKMLAALIRSYLFAGIFRAAAEAMVTENAARLARMQQAERSVDEQLDELMAETRSVRQDEVTTELLDVIIGFEALKGRGKRKPMRKNI